MATKNYLEEINELRKLLPQYLEMTGRSTRKNFSCASGDHKDEHPSMKYYHSSESCFCFSCRKAMSIFDIVGADYGLTDFKDMVSKVREIFKLERGNVFIPPPKAHEEVTYQTDKKDYRKFFYHCHRHIAETNYPAIRGLSDKIVQKAELGYHPEFMVGDNKKWQALIIPVNEGSYVIRNINPIDKSERYRNSRGGKQLYLKFADMRNPNTPVVITEGEIDALSVAEIGGEAISLGSVGNVGKFVKYLKETGITDKPIIISLDNDEAGLSAQKELSKKLSELGANFICFNLSGGCHDINEHLCHDRTNFEQRYHEACEFAQNVKKEAVKSAKKDQKVMCFKQKLEADIKSWRDIVAVYNQKRELPNNNNFIRVMDAPLVMSLIKTDNGRSAELGIPIMAGKEIFEKVFETEVKRHNAHGEQNLIEDFMELPKELADPIMILKNRNPNGDILPNDILVVIPVKTAKGIFELVPIELKKIYGRYKIKTFFSKETKKDWIKERLDLGDLLYANISKFEKLKNSYNNKITEAAELRGHQSPTSVNLGDYLNNSIPTEKALVNPQNEILDKRKSTTLETDTIRDLFSVGFNLSNAFPESIIVPTIKNINQDNLISDVQLEHNSEEETEEEYER